MLPTSTAPHAESVPFMLVRTPEPTSPELDAEPESARAVDARRPPARANVTMEDLPSIMVEAPALPEAVVRLAPIDVPLVAPPLTASLIVWPEAMSLSASRALSVAPARARGATPARAVAVALLGIMMGLAVGGSAVAWRTHGATLPSFVTLAR